MSLTLRDALSHLSKASPFSVKTVSAKPSTELDKAKEWLYIQQEIETDFRKRLDCLEANEIVFLCGSSGDGKSEILARCRERYYPSFKFHLDGTHSFSPQQSAIEALDQLFDDRCTDPRPLVIGINIGMLANYANEGAAQHSEIKKAIDCFLHGEAEKGQYHFLDFEHYPKFQFCSDPNGSYSKFAKQLMQKLTLPSEENPFYALCRKDEQAGRDLALVANYKLLALDAVQNAIITNLFKARLINDQFLTARNLLDFIHHLLLGEGYLADNLFGGSDNELVQRMEYFDPALLHTQALDQFVLRYELSLSDEALSSFIASLQAEGLIIWPFTQSGQVSATLIRLFYLLQGASIGNNYHHQFKTDFEEAYLDEYTKVWLLHCNYDGSPASKTALRPFYTNELIDAIYRYANRNAPWLRKGEIFLGQFGAVQLAAPIDLKADYNGIPKAPAQNVSRFYACLKIADQALAPIAINMNLFELICKLNCGYRPNKYDKNAVVLLDEIIEQIADVAKQSNKLRFYEDGHCHTAQQEDDVIEVNRAN